MSIDFAPSIAREAVGAEICDLRMTVVESAGGSRAWRKRSVAIDLRMHPRVAKAFGLTDGDRVVGSVDEDGTWTLRKVDSSEPGYLVRKGGKGGSRGMKVNGRSEFLYFRFSTTRQAARVVFGDRKVTECDLMDVAGNTAMFIPKVHVGQVTFQPTA